MEFQSYLAIWENKKSTACFCFVMVLLQCQLLKQKWAWNEAPCWDHSYTLSHGQFCKPTHTAWDIVEYKTVNIWTRVVFSENPPQTIDKNMKCNFMALMCFLTRIPSDFCCCFGKSCSPQTWVWPPGLTMPWNSSRISKSERTKGNFSFREKQSKIKLLFHWPQISHILPNQSDYPSQRHCPKEKGHVFQLP